MFFFDFLAEVNYVLGVELCTFFFFFFGLIESLVRVLHEILY